MRSLGTLSYSILGTLAGLGQTICILEFGKTFMEMFVVKVTNEIEKCYGWSFNTGNINAKTKKHDCVDGILMFRVTSKTF